MLFALHWEEPKKLAIALGRKAKSRWSQWSWHLPVHVWQLQTQALNRDGSVQGQPALRQPHRLPHGGKLQPHLERSLSELMYFFPERSLVSAHQQLGGKRACFKIQMYSHSLFGK